MSDDRSPEDKDKAERFRPPGELRSWERREDPCLASEKRWARLAKTIGYAVWIVFLLLGMAAIVYLVKNPPR